MLAQTDSTDVHSPFPLLLFPKEKAGCFTNGTPTCSLPRRSHGNAAKEVHADLSEPFF